MYLAYVVFIVMVPVGSDMIGRFSGSGYPKCTIFHTNFLPHTAQTMLNKLVTTSPSLLNKLEKVVSICAASFIFFRSQHCTWRRGYLCKTSFWRKKNGGECSCRPKLQLLGVFLIICWLEINVGVCKTYFSQWSTGCLLYISCVKVPSVTYSYILSSIYCPLSGLPRMFL